MKNRNWFWGVFFLLAAVFVIGSQTGAFGQFGLFTIVATIFLIAILVHSIMDIEFFGMFMSLAFLYMIYSGPLSLVWISPWVLLLAAVLTSMGFSMIFRGTYKRRFHNHYKQCECEWGDEHFTKTTENVDDNNPSIRVSFGAASKYLHSDCLKSGNFTSSFGTLEVYFDQVQLSPDGAEIFVDCSFGEIKLFVPRQWQVIEGVHVGLGSVKNKSRMARPEDNAPKLKIVGNVQFGDVEINYI